MQQTLWRLFVPAEDYVLGYDRTFSVLAPYESQTLLGQLASGQPCPVAFKLDRQGALMELVRQGGPGELSVWTMGREAFSIVIWVLVIVVGALMLRLTWYKRVLWILGIVLAAMVVHLWKPLLVEQMAAAAWPAAVLVAVLWLAKWLFCRSRTPKDRPSAAAAWPAKPAPAAPAPSPAAPAQAASAPAPDADTTKPSTPDKKE